MLKKTTIYLSESDLEILKQVSFINQTSMTEIIRQGIQKLCESFSAKELEVFNALGAIKEDMKKSGRTVASVNKAVLKGQREVRRGRKKGGHRY